MNITSEPKAQANSEYRSARDPLCDIVIPPRDASGDAKLSSMREYIRKLAKATRAESDSILPGLDQHVQDVLKAGRKYPLHIVLLRHLLERYQVPGRGKPIEDLTQGFDLIGDILVDETIEEDDKAVRDYLVSEDQLVSRASRSSDKLQKIGPSKELSEEDVEEIFRQTEVEIPMGRMQKFEDVGIGPEFPPTRRFAVQQLSSEGSTKLRPIDDYLSSQINGLSRVGKRIFVGKTETIISSMTFVKRHRPGQKLVTTKLDFKAAYRSCPIKREHPDWTTVIVWDPKKKRYRQTQHFCMPFGAVSAVYAWHRVGQALTAILSSALTIPFNRHVDDRFAAIPKDGATEARNFCLEIIELLGFDRCAKDVIEMCETNNAETTKLFKERGECHAPTPDASVGAV